MGTVFRFYCTRKEPMFNKRGSGGGELDGISYNIWLFSWGSRNCRKRLQSEGRWFLVLLCIFLRGAGVLSGETGRKAIQYSLSSFDDL